MVCKLVHKVVVCLADCIILVLLLDGRVVSRNVGCAGESRQTSGLHVCALWQSSNGIQT